MWQSADVAYSLCRDPARKLPLAEWCCRIDQPWHENIIRSVGTDTEDPVVM